MAISFANTKGKAQSNKVDTYAYKDGDNVVRLVGGVLPRYVYWVKGTNNKDIPIECLAFNRENEKFDNKGLFVTNSNKFFENKTIITESLRNDDYDKFDDKTTGKVGIKQYIWNELNVSSNYGTAYNVPTLYNLYSIYGNKDLNPEKTKGYDFGVEYLGLSAIYFDTKIDDMIDYDSNVSKYGNIRGTSNLKGYELGYKKAVIEDIFLNQVITL
mgnify:CR=1 FL=1